MKPFTFQEGGSNGATTRQKNVILISDFCCPIYLLCQKSDYLVTLYDRFWCVILVSRGKIDFGLVMSCLLHIYNFTECGSMRVWILSSLRLESSQKKNIHVINNFVYKFIHFNEMVSQYENWKCLSQFERSYWSSLGMKNYYFKFSFSRFFLQSKDMEIFCTIITAMLHIFFSVQTLYSMKHIFFVDSLEIWPTSTSNT